MALAESVDLRGRGGAAFPFARKLAAIADVAHDRGAQTVVLVRGVDGELPIPPGAKVLAARSGVAGLPTLLSNTESALEVFGADVAAHLATGTCGRPIRNTLPLPGDGDQEDLSAVRLSVDRSRCAGHGLCGMLVPDLIRLDSSGYPVISDSPVETWLLGGLKQAIEMCPALALTLTGPHMQVPLTATQRDHG